MWIALFIAIYCRVAKPSEGKKKKTLKGDYAYNYSNWSYIGANFLAKRKGRKDILVRRAGIQLVLAVSAGVRQLANAFVIVHEVDAGATVLAGSVGAIVDVGLAVGAGITGQTLAAVAIQMILARSAVLARIRAALVDVRLASLAAVTGQTMADELIHSVLASAAVQARRTRALVHIAQTSGIVVAARTFASIAVHQVDATPAVRTRITRALVNVGLAILAGEAWLALAGIPERQYVVSTENGKASVDDDALTEPRILPDYATLYLCMISQSSIK